MQSVECLYTVSNKLNPEEQQSVSQTQSLKATAMMYVCVQ